MYFMFSQHFSGGPPSTLSRYHIVHISKTANPNISKNIFLNSPNGLESPPIGFQHAHFQKKFQCSEDGSQDLWQSGHRNRHKNILDKLDHGWNTFVQSEDTKMTFRPIRALTRQLSSGLVRFQTRTAN